MKKMLLVLGIAGSSVFLSGQAPPAQPRVTAERIQQISNSVWHFSGTIRIEAANVVITADEADGRVAAPGSPMEFDLRGNVHMTMTPYR